MDLRALRWLTVAVPLAFLILVDILRHQVWPGLLHPWPGYVLVLAVLFVAVLAFSRAVFDRVERLDAQILRQNAELRDVGETARQQAAQLRTLHAAGLTLASDLSLESVLRRIVDLARELTGARYGALAVVDDGGQIVRFLTAGLTPDQRAQLAEPPTGHGLLGRIFTDVRPIRVNEIGRDPRSVGFPPGHPPMTTFLGVPIARHGRTYGNLYLTDKQADSGPVPFTEDDAQAVSLFAAQAAITMENARLHAEVQGLGAATERDRIARELHDSLAQALGYVRMQVAIGRRALPADPATADAALAHIDAVTTDAYAEVREAILGLRTSGASASRSLVDALQEYIERYQEQTGVTVELQVGVGVAEAGLAPAVEVQLVRIIQEALANVRKHARTSNASLSLELVMSAGGPRIRAVVADEGRGFAVGQPSADAGFEHIGLSVMRERAEGIGGTVEVQSAPDRGTRVCVDVPVDSAPASVEA